MWDHVPFPSFLLDESMPATDYWHTIVTSHTAPGDVILIPFAQEAMPARVALAAGRRVVALVRTPAQQLRLWGALMPLEEADRRRALARLAATTKRDTPLDQHINSLYQTTCPDCGQATPATAFIWDRTCQYLQEKTLVCAACGFQGRAAVDQADIRRAAGFEPHGLSYWFILEWLVDIQDSSGRQIAGQRLDAYSPRNLTALADITRKIDLELADDAATQRILRLWLLHALEAGRWLPDLPHGEQCIEPNIWHTFTHAPVCEEPAGSEESVPLRWVFDLQEFFELSQPPPNLAIAAGPARKLLRALPPASVALVVGAPPVLDAEAWIWEQIWSRWLFGRAGAGMLHPPIGGWSRHVRALAKTMQALGPALQPDSRLISCFADPDPDRAGAFLLALSPMARLESFAFQPRIEAPDHLFHATGGAYQMVFVRSDSPPPASDTAPVPQTLAMAVQQVAARAAGEILQVRGEPLPYSWILARALAHLARAGLLARLMHLNNGLSPLAFVFQHVRQGLRVALGKRQLVTVGAFKPTHWWLPQPPPTPPLAERVEQVVLDLLAGPTPVTPAAVYQAFPGWLLPEPELVTALLTAHGQKDAAGGWRSRTDQPQEAETLRMALYALGRRLGFSVGTGLAEVVWGEKGQATHAFQIVHRRCWRSATTKTLPEGVAGYLVLPDHLVMLVRVMLQRDPLWHDTWSQQGWQVLKAQHLLALLDQARIDRQIFKKIVGLDPLIEQDHAQMPLL